MRLFFFSTLTDGRRRGSEGDEDHGEAQDEEADPLEHRAQSASTTGVRPRHRSTLELGGREARDHGHVARDERQHAGREERQDAGPEGDENAGRIGRDRSEGSRRRGPQHPCSSGDSCGRAPCRPRPSWSTSAAKSTSRGPAEHVVRLPRACRRGDPPRPGAGSVSSMTTCCSQSSPAASKASRHSSRTSWVSPVDTT